MKLHYRTYGDQHRDRPPLVLLHGLFGSGANWHSIATRLSEIHRVLVPDLRNHGRSPHDEDVSYPAMAADILELLDDLEIDQAWMVGHSMGGKVAMLLSLTEGSRVAGLVSVDMAPVRYPDRFADIYRALEGVPLPIIRNRKMADELLAGHLAAPDLRAYLLQNLVKSQGEWSWRMNLASLSMMRQVLFDFPAIKAQFLGSALFLRGGKSDYVKPEYGAVIKQYFPYAKERTVATAGHWVYAETPDEFLEVLFRFLT